MAISENIDICVCNPNVAINKQLQAVYIQFEVMDSDTQQGTGKSHTVLMTTPAAMTLLYLLETLQEKFSLSKMTGEIPMVELSEEKKKH